MSTPRIEFLPYHPRYKDDFKRINLEWLEELFRVEPYDDYILSNPEEAIISRGGQIYFAVVEDLGVVGCCALCLQGDGYAELTKMGVLKKARGLKIGEPLLQHVLQQAEAQGLRVYLLTNSKCEAAIHPYLKNGFERDEPLLEKYGQRYARVDVAMIHRPQSFRGAG